MSSDPLERVMTVGMFLQEGYAVVFGDDAMSRYMIQFMERQLDRLTRGSSVGRAADS